MIEVRIDDKFMGPSILDMAFFLDSEGEGFEVKWENSKAELRVIRRYLEKSFTLVVKDIPAMERTCLSLGLRYAVEQATIVSRIKELNKGPSGKWRRLASEEGGSSSRAVLLQAVADRIRRGKDLDSLRKVTLECLIDGTPILEAALLLNLRVQGLNLQ